MHHQEGIVVLSAAVQQLCQLHPLSGTHPGAVLVEGHFQVQVGKLVQLWDNIQQVVQHVTCRCDKPQLVCRFLQGQRQQASRSAMSDHHKLKADMDLEKGCVNVVNIQPVLHCPYKHKGSRLMQGNLDQSGGIDALIYILSTDALGHALATKASWGYVHHNYAHAAF